MRYEQVDFWGLSQSDRGTIKRVLLRGRGTANGMIGSIKSFVGELPNREPVIEKLSKLSPVELELIWDSICRELE